MLAVDDTDAYRQGRVATTVTEPLADPSPSTTGPVGVFTGYPKTRRVLRGSWRPST
jgi:hypothetical protein